MAVIRVNKTADYTVMSNTHFKESEMSLKAKGLLSLMLSLPDNWDYSINGLVSLSKDGRDSVRKALEELEKYGYLKRTALKDKQGRFAGYEYDIYETPIVENLTTEKPLSENPTTENPIQLNTKQSSTKQSSTKQLSTKEINKELNNNISTDFETLWKMYPRKLGKPKALKAYQKAVKEGATFDEVKSGIDAYCQYIKTNKVKTEYIKHGSTWFNGKCWLDEYEETKPPEPKRYGGLYL